jgi:hypothetical protein
MENRHFNTGVCENTHSKRVIVNALTGVKAFFGLPVYTVRGGTVERRSFDGAMTVEWCLCLTGAVVEGVSLLDACALSGSGFSCDTSGGFRSLFRSFVESAISVRNETGSLPRMFLNGIYSDVETGVFTYLPQGLAEFLFTYLSEEKRKSIFFVVGGRVKGGAARRSVPNPPVERFPGENVFSESCARFIYLHLADGGAGPDSPVYFLADRVPGFPFVLAELVWNAMRGKTYSLESLLESIELPPSESAAISSRKHSGKVPLHKRKGYLDFIHLLKHFFSSSLKLVILIVLLSGVLAYVVLDIAGKKGPRDNIPELAPRGVVELYYSAMNDLDLDVVQSLFYRRAGRKVVNELSTLYVMSRLGQVYNKQYEDAETGGSSSILSIQVLEIEQVSDGYAPVFHTRYKKTINTGDKRTEYLIEETLSIGRIRNRWYIVEDQSRIAE